MDRPLRSSDRGIIPGPHDIVESRRPRSNLLEGIVENVRQWTNAPVDVKVMNILVDPDSRHIVGLDQWEYSTGKAFALQ